MTTQPGWEPRPGPTRGETARRAPRGAAGGWPDDPARRRTAGPARTGGPDRTAGPDRTVGPAGSGRAEPRTRDPRNGPGWAGPGDRGRGGPRPPREPRQRLGDGAPGGPGRSPLRWIGALSTRNAMLALVAGTVIGIVATLVAGAEPGFLLSFFIIVGAVVGTLGVRPGAVYLFFPLPAFAFFLGALITGKIHDSTLSSSTAGLAAGFTQWIAGIFFPMCAATILVLVIGGARWLLSRQLVGGQFTMSADRPVTSRSPRPRPAAAPGQDVDPWNDEQPARNRPGQRPGKAPWLGPDGAATARPPRKDRDPWNDPRPTADPRTA